MRIALPIVRSDRHRLHEPGAAARRAARTGGPVAVIDIDAHHGSGTQTIFWQRADVVTGSVHVDPGAGWFPAKRPRARWSSRSASTPAIRRVPSEACPPATARPAPTTPRPSSSKRAATT
jgi:hypothetical protein